MKLVNLNDHEFARYLRNQKAINNFRHLGNSVQWHDNENQLVAVAIYDNSACTRNIYIIT